MHAQIDLRVQGSQVRRREREHDDAEERAVLGIDAAREVDRRLARDAADHRLTDENSRRSAVEVNAEMLAVVEVDRLRRWVEGSGDELAIGPDNGTLGRGARQQGDLACPVMDIEFAMRSPHAPGDDFHSSGDPVENMRDLILKGDREISSLRAGAIERCLSRGHDRGPGHHPHRRDDQDAKGDDFARDDPGAAARVARGRDEHAPISLARCVIRAHRP